MGGSFSSNFSPCLSNVLDPELFVDQAIFDLWQSSQAPGGWVPKWAQEALGSLITCRQCSNAIKEVDPGNGRRASFISKTYKLLCRYCFQWPCFLTALGFWGTGIYCLVCEVVLL